MNFKLALGLGFAALSILAGCSSASDGASEEAFVSESDFVGPLHAVDVTGAWHSKAGGSTTAQSFEGIYFGERGTFFADIDTGIRCITTPCPSSVRIEGTYRVLGRSLVLTANDPADDGRYYARYSISRVGNDLKISGDRIESTLSREISYCSEASDCDEQPIIVPDCVGRFSCTERRSCAFSCGMPMNPVWPTDKTKLVAETRGGGFTPPPPPGSSCAIGAAKYTLDYAARTISWEVCDFIDWNTPLTTVTGSRAATAADFVALDSAMRSVSVTHAEICGADKPMLNITVTSASQGTKTFTDSFYSCMGGGRTFVDNIDEVFGAFRNVTAH